MKSAFAAKEVSLGKWKDVNPSIGGEAASHVPFELVDDEGVMMLNDRVIDDIDDLFMSPIHTIVIGHCGTHSKTTLAALTAIGITNKQTVKRLLFDLSTMSAYHLSSCQAAYERACKRTGVG